jgi:LuxR family transcriptional regulator, maltose regulon positive regulatory protein
MGAAARMASCVIALLSGDDEDAEEIDRARDEIDTVAVPWLTRVARIALLRAGTSAMRSGDQARADMAVEFIESCQREGDRWGAALICLLHGMDTVVTQAPDCSMLNRAARSFDDLGAGSLAAMAAAFEAVGERQVGDGQAALEASSRARLLGSPRLPLAYGLALLVEGVEVGDAVAQERARSILAPVGAWDRAAFLVGLCVPTAVPGDRRAPTPAAEAAVNDPRVSLKCLGGFALKIDGKVFEESLAKPMERSVLHLLSARVGEKVHREEIVEALWPEADPHAGRHRLQVAVSSLRRLLAQFADGLQLLAREGDNYSLVLPADADVDRWKVEGHLRAAADARFAGDVVAERSALYGAVTAYGGSLLPMDGPAEWAQEPRLQLQTAVADAAARLAHLLADSGDFQGVAEIGRRGLSVDRFRDDLWRICIDAAERSGNQADATRTRKAYDNLLVELGVSTS